MDIIKTIADELSVQVAQVAAAEKLLSEGATVPFIARYRKEVTGGLDDGQLRQLQERLLYLNELQERKQVILKSIAEQDKLTPALQKDIEAADTKVRLEDLYRPYKPKRRTKAQIAREAGLAPLAESLLSDPSQDPESLAEQYLNAEHKIDDAKAALDGARQILMEQFAEQAELIGELRDYMWEHALLQAKVNEDKKAQAQKYQDYFEHQELLCNIPSHRALAILRGRKEGFLQVSLVLEDESYGVNAVASYFNINQQQRPADKWLMDTATWAWKVKIFTHIEIELMNRMREASETVAIDVFAGNLRDLLLAAPAGPKVTIGLDPGLRTGVKVVVVDATGKLLEYTTIYPHMPQKQWNEAIAVLVKLCCKYTVELISIGNGTASRETDRLVIDLIKQFPKLNLQKIVVSESGASVYSASELAAQEFPDVDVSIRGAVSIARRLQDPLAELVKIDPKAIGVGQYQHDVSQAQLARMLGNVVEDCVNGVGVDLNTASVPLLKKVSGLNDTLAHNVVAFRDKNGRFNNRKQLLDVPRMGDKSYEQAAGFLRIMDGDNPLDASCVHPEAYPLVEKIITQTGKDVKEIIANDAVLSGLKAKEYTDEQFGLPTVTDIINELRKPGRDPRPEFKTASFKEGVEDIKDLKEGMVLEGVVSNVADFGAFVDIGVHQDGLVHISQMNHQFVKDPRTVVKAGQVVKVKVMEIEPERKRISLTMRLDEQTGAKAKQKPQVSNKPKKQHKPRKNRKTEPTESAMGSALADALAKAKG